YHLLKKGGEAATRALNPEPNESKVKRGCEEMRIYFFTAPLAYSDFPGGSKSRLYKISLSLCHKKASRHKNHHFQHVIYLILEGNQKT
ncbi:MAG: hypothetical protein KHZ23_07835, partial [Dialister sp.]|nr:hypothetical protein [Dialister sp.]